MGRNDRKKLQEGIIGENYRMNLWEELLGRKDIRKKLYVEVRGRIYINTLLGDSIVKKI